MGLRANASGTFGGTDSGTGVQVGPGSFMFMLSGTFVGTVVAEVSFDGGTTWIPLTLPWTATAVSLTAPLALVLYLAADVCDGKVPVQVRARCSAYTSGTITWRIAQATTLGN